MSCCLCQAGVVPPGWVSNDAFLAGYGAAQAVPGPLFTFAAYLGAVMPEPLGGWVGGAAMLLAIFLPAFLLVAGALPFWEALRQRLGVQRDGRHQRRRRRRARRGAVRPRVHERHPLARGLRAGAGGVRLARRCARGAGVGGGAGRRGGVVDGDVMRRGAGGVRSPCGTRSQSAPP
ncbi:MAG: chromate transporter [Rubrivivax sp.]